MILLVAPGSVVPSSDQKAIVELRTQRRSAILVSELQCYRGDTNAPKEGDQVAVVVVQTLVPFLYCRDQAHCAPSKASNGRGTNVQLGTLFLFFLLGSKSTEFIFFQQSVKIELPINPRFVALRRTLLPRDKLILHSPGPLYSR